MIQDHISRPSVLIFIILLVFTQTPSPAICDAWTGTTDHAFTLATDNSGYGGYAFNDDATLIANPAQVTFNTLKAGTHAGRPDWDAAMAACATAGYSVAECSMSVGDGEF